MVPIKTFDIVNGIIAHLGEKYEFTAERIRIHNAFYKLASEAKYKALFSQFSFSKSSEYHKSEEIEEGLDNLILARLLSAKNPDLINYQVSPSLYRVYVEKKPTLLSDKVELIKAASKRFAQLIK